MNLSLLIVVLDDFEDNTFGGDPYGGDDYAGGMGDMGGYGGYGGDPYGGYGGDPYGGYGGGGGPEPIPMEEITTAEELTTFLEDEDQEPAVIGYFDLSTHSADKEVFDEVLPIPSPLHLPLIH